MPLVQAIVERLTARRLAIAPLVLASQVRVALGDPIAEALGAQICIMVIGERPGFSAADSVGIYVTCSPQSGTPDSRRNCISNIRDGGLAIDAAVAALVADMLKTGISGVGLKAALEAHGRAAVADGTGSQSPDRVCRMQGPGTMTISEAKWRRRSPSSHRAVARGYFSIAATLSFVTMSRPVWMICDTFCPFLMASSVSIAFSPISNGRWPISALA